MKYSRSQLKHVKSALRELKTEESETPPVDESETDAAVTLAQARAIARDSASEEERQLKLNAKQAKRDLYENVTKEREVTFNWQYSVGDAVMIDGYDGTTDFGIVIEMKTGTGTTEMAAYRSSGVRVMSSAGKYWVKPSSVTKLDDSCN